MDGWTVLDGINQAPLTGMLVPADVTLDLDRFTATGARVDCSEIVSWTEKGSTGFYTISFTPQNSGLYILTLNEVDPASMGRKGIEFRWDVLPAGAFFSPTYTNAFCAETDIERWINASISPSTSPNDNEAAAWAESAAAWLMSLTARLGFAQTPTTVTAGSRMEDLLREANAIKAALDYLTAQTRGVAPFDAGRGRLSLLKDLWESYVGFFENGKWIPGIIEQEISGNSISLSTDHILSGDTAAATATHPTDIGIIRGMGDLY
ncbi:MAG TPA: hypothetical protein VKD72_12510 [Gemmataceae bacterium]|nr:hypothetical protein [Gemmataceae bacterium]